MESDCRLGDLVVKSQLGTMTQSGEIESLSCQEEEERRIETDGQTVKKTDEHHQHDGTKFHIDQNVRNAGSQHIDNQDLEGTLLPKEQKIRLVDFSHVRNQVVQDDQDVRNLSEKGVVRCLEEGCQASFDTKEARQQHEEGAHGGKKFRCNLCNFSCLTHGAYGQFLLIHVNLAINSIIIRLEICHAPISTLLP